MLNINGLESENKWGRKKTFSSVNFFQPKKKKKKSTTISQVEFDYTSKCRCIRVACVRGHQPNAGPVVIGRPPSSGRPLKVSKTSVPPRSSALSRLLLFFFRPSDIVCASGGHRLRRHQPFGFAFGPGSLLKVYWLICKICISLLKTSSHILLSEVSLALSR